MCWKPSKHRGLAKPHSKGYDYTPGMQRCMGYARLLTTARPGALSALPSGFCPPGSMQAKDMSFLGDPGTPWNPQWIVGEGRGRLFILSSAGLFRLHVGRGQSTPLPTRSAPRLSGHSHEVIWAGGLESWGPSNTRVSERMPHQSLCDLGNVLSPSVPPSQHLLNGAANCTYLQRGTELLHVKSPGPQ